MKGLSIVGLALTSTLSAQQVAPSSLTATEGNVSSTVPFGWTIGRYQQIHGALQGTPMTITAIAFRRDASVTGGGTPLWWSEIVVRMADGKFEQAGNDFDGNYLGAAVEVFHRDRLVLPDWSQPTAASPAPFDLVIPLDVPYVHTGAHPLLWEIEVFDKSNAGVLGAIDAFEQPVFATTPATQYGTSCGFSLIGSASVINDNRFYLWLGEQPYQQTAQRLLAFGYSDPNVLVPGLCAPLRVEPIVVLSPGLGVNFGMYAPYNPALAGTSLRAQELALTSTQLLMSNAVELTLPAMPALGDRDVCNVRTVSWGALPNQLQRGAGIVVQFL
ncbi:MAG: hypothetical protein R3F29_12580 [Planctomycetota bacterium]